MRLAPQRRTAGLWYNTHPMRLPGPLRIGWESVTANAVPMAVLWAAAVLLAVLYYASPEVAGLFEPLINWELACGWKAAVVTRVVFAGIVPGLFFLTISSIRPRHPLAKLFLQILWCGSWGVVCDHMYVWVDALFGSGTDPRTVAVKVLFDQLPWTVLVVMPANALFYFWLGRDFSIRRMKAEWPKSFWSERVLPMLLLNWCVWIPVTIAVFILPLPLRVHVNGLAASFWTLACLYLGSRAKVVQS